ncbi:MAG: hypothetical protein J7L46_04240 [Bacteroidales bacterium]|nr:hypothetical protein [Bacteroidales bacterium]
MKQLFLVLVFSLLVWNMAKADSPLTSTKFATAYYDNDFVQVARQSDGILTPKLMSFLIDKKIPIDIKIAIIDELGWRISGKDNYTTFLNYLMEKKIVKSKSKIKKASADIILSLAYLKAMDNYFNVKDAIKLAEMAKANAPKSYTVNLIAALIQAQRAMDNDWCKVFRLTDDVRQNKSLTQDMRPEASEIIFLYMDAYKSECK